MTGLMEMNGLEPFDKALKVTLNTIVSILFSLFGWKLCNEKLGKL